jgi:hypothetical protein
MLGDVCSLRYLQLQVVVSLGSWLLSPVDVAGDTQKQAWLMSCRWRAAYRENFMQHAEVTNDGSRDVDDDRSRLD